MTDADGGGPLLVLGPLLRYVGETEATIWVETDRACQAGILGHQARTFEVAGERIRQAADLEHWAAFGTSFAAFEQLLTGLATGAFGAPPASVTVLGGTVPGASGSPHLQPVCETGLS